MNSQTPEMGRRRMLAAAVGAGALLFLIHQFGWFDLLASVADGREAGEPAPVGPRAQKPSPSEPGPNGVTPPRLVTQLGHPSGIGSMALSGDARWVATGGWGDRTVRLWEAASGKLIRRFDHLIAAPLAGDFSLVRVALSVDGKRLATASDTAVHLWDTVTGKELQRFPAMSSWSVSLSDNGKYLAAGYLNNTVRLWDCATGKKLRELKGRDVALSGDGNWLATGDGTRTARLWETATGKETQQFGGKAKELTPVGLSFDGKRLVTRGNDNTAIVWDNATGKELMRFPGWIYVSLSGDGNRIAIAAGNEILTYDLPTGKTLKRFRCDSLKEIAALSLSRSGERLGVAGFSGFTSPSPATLWDTTSGEQLQRFEGNSEPVVHVSLSLDGNRLAVMSFGKSNGAAFAGPDIGGTVRLWDMSAGRQQDQRFQEQPGEVTATALSGDGRRLATGCKSGAAFLWDAASSKKLQQFPSDGNMVRAVSVPINAKSLVTTSFGKVRLWDAASAKELQQFQGEGIISADGTQIAMLTKEGAAQVRDSMSGKLIQAIPTHGVGIALSGNGKQLATVGGGYFGGGSGGARLWNVATGKEYGGVDRGVAVRTGWSTGVAFSQEGKLLAVASPAGAARLFDVATGKQVRVFQGHSAEVNSVALSGDNKWLITGSDDSSTRLWEAATGKELCQLISFRDGTWAVVDSAGRFDASNGGDVDGLHWVAGVEPIALKQLKERYYDPGLLAKYMGFNKAPLRPVAAFRDVKLHAHVEAEPLIAGTSTLTLKLTNRGGGIGKVQVFVNGRELLADARGPKFDADAATATMSVDLAGAVALPGEKNRVRIVTWNAEGYLSSRGLDLDWEPPGRKDEQKMELHAIVVGVSTYDSDALKLRFAAKDAADVAKALELGGKRLFGADKTHVTLLCDGAIAPTRVNLEKAFEAARKCRPTDVLVVYLAGHGIALPEQGQEVYCYLTKDARTVNQDAFRDPDLRRKYSLTSTELTEWFKKIPALKQVLILDTCAAGAAAKKLIENRDVGADQIRAIDRLRDRTGFHVLMGCASDRVSYEASQYSQGLLTYALLQGMRGAKLREGEYVDVMDLFQYAADQVPQLAQNIGGIQKPLIMAPRGTSFDIGRLKDDDKKLIPLAQVRPLILRPLLQNADENVLDDDLGLMTLLRKRLIEQGYAARGPGEQAAVFVDADDMPGAIRPTGKYTIEGKLVSVRVLLRRDGKTVGVVQVDGQRDQLDALADRLATAIAAKLKTP